MSYEENTAIPDSLSQFVKTIICTYQNDSFIVGEEANIACSFFVLSSAFFGKDQKLHEILTNVTGAGKSTLVEAVIALKETKGWINLLPK